MQRITISITDELGDALEEMVIERGYKSRSEAMRDLVDDGIEQWRHERKQGEYCVASLSYTVNRRIRVLRERLAELIHSHHNLVMASTAVILDHDHSLENLMLKGKSAEVRAFADQVRAERGIRFGTLNMLLVSPSDEHDRMGAREHHANAHLSPLL